MGVKMNGLRQLCFCGSMSVIDAMEEISRVARELGYRVSVPDRGESELPFGTLAQAQAVAIKRRQIQAHIAKIRDADMVILANYEKNDTEGYIGPSALLEAGIAHALGKPVVTLFPIGRQGCQLEVEAISMGAIGSDPSRWEDGQNNS